MKKLLLYIAISLSFASCSDNGNTGNPPADTPDINDQGAAVKSGDPGATKARDHDTGKTYRDTSLYPKN
ncbi:MAG TPA: hypothetical protein VGF30_13305 [Bacteroidia bacterium]